MNEVAVFPTSEAGTYLSDTQIYSSVRSVERETARRRVHAFRGKYGQGALRLAYHAAVPVVLNSEFLHLLRVNFFLDPPELLPYTMETNLLLCSFCQEIGDDLYEIEPPVRDVLLEGLLKEYGQDRVRKIAAMLWQYTQRRMPWGEQVMLERAQQLTALNLLDPTKAKEWIAEAENYVRVSRSGEREWFVAMRTETKWREASLLLDLDKRADDSLLEAQRWVALAYTEPEEAARRLAQEISETGLQNKAKLIRVTSLVEVLADPLREFETLLTYCRGISELLAVDLNAAKTQFDKILKQGKAIQIFGVSLPVPEEILALLSPEDTVDVVFAEVRISIPSPQTIAGHRAALRQRLEADARARWGGMGVYIQEEGATLPIEASPYEVGRMGPRQNLLGMLHTANRLLVLGEPGSGKTVALERLAWELCEDEKPVVPVLVRLFHYAGTPLREWVRALLQETGHLRLDDDRALTAFLKEGGARCFFLFDGLNEVPPPYRDMFVGELVRWCGAFHDHPLILTSRAQDELWRRLRFEMDKAVAIQPIADEQAREYLVAHLGRAGGHALYRRLDSRMQEMARMPLILWLIKEAGAAGESLPGNRGELYTRFVSRILRRDTDRRLDAEIPERVKRQALADLAYYMSLAQRLTCRRDEAVQAVAQRLEEDQAERVVTACARHGLLAGEENLWFAPHQTVQDHFAALALREMAEREWEQGVWGQVLRNGRQLLTRQPQGLASLAADDWWTETIIQLAGVTDDVERLVQTVGRANPWLAWWCVVEGRSVNEATRTWVEDRSARLLRSKRASDRRRAVQALAGMRSERAAEPLFQAAADADPRIAELAVKALMGLAGSAQALVARSLQGSDRHLWLAAIRYLRAKPDDLLWAAIPEQMWDELLEVADRRLVIDALVHLDSEQAADRLLGIATGSHEETANLAMQALLQMGEAARNRALRAAQQQTSPLHQAGLAYLSAMLGQPMIWVPPGPFLMGSNKAMDQNAYDHELPQHQVALSGYWIGYHSVTVAQFQAFSQESGYRLRDEGSLEGPEDHPVVYVTWYDALAYCRWLAVKTSLPVTLPSEAEWEKAARGTDGRLYPWGDNLPDESRCNCGNKVRKTTSVGQYSPQGDSPYGCADMAGNVWEWTRSLWGKSEEGLDFRYPYNPTDGREDLQAQGSRVLRGGSWICSQNKVRCACRYSQHTEDRNNDVGFRLVLAPAFPF